MFCKNIPTQPSVNQVTSGNFGLLVAYLLPGFVALWGVAAYSETIRTWLATGGSSSPSIGGFLYLTLASLTAGLLVSTLRWAAVDTIHHAAGIRPPEWDFNRLRNSLPAFELLIENYYRYYQFYANTAIAAAVAYGAWRTTCCFGSGALDFAFVAVECLLLFGSRDTLRKYYRGVDQLSR